MRTRGRPLPKPSSRISGPIAIQFVAAFIDSAGTELTVFLDRAAFGAESGNEGFTMTGLSGGATTLTWAGESLTNHNIRFTINRTVADAETGGVLAYTPGVVRAVNNGPFLTVFSGKVVTNNSVQ